MTSRSVSFLRLVAPHQYPEASPELVVYAAEVVARRVLPVVGESRLSPRRTEEWRPDHIPRIRRLETRASRSSRSQRWLEQHL